jgi:hypothetical protein
MKGYQVVKRYGLYARHIRLAFRKALELLRRAKQLLFSFFSKRFTWRQRIINSFRKDPLLCPICGVEMEFWFLWHPEEQKQENLTPSSEEVQLYL